MQMMGLLPTREGGVGARAPSCEAHLLDAAAAQVYGGDGLALLLAQAPEQVVQRQPRKRALVRTCWGTPGCRLALDVAEERCGARFPMPTACKPGIQVPWVTV